MQNKFKEYRIIRVGEEHRGYYQVVPKFDDKMPFNLGAEIIHVIETKAIESEKKEITRLMAIIQKAVEMAESILECPHWDCCTALTSKTTSVIDYNKCDCHVKEAREFLSTLADASGEMNKDGKQ